MTGIGSVCLFCPKQGKPANNRALGDVRNIDVSGLPVAGKAHEWLAGVRAKAMKLALTEVSLTRTRSLMIASAEWIEVGAWCSHPAEPALLKVHA
jgi:hypothetical protein